MSGVSFSMILVGRMDTSETGAGSQESFTSVHTGTSQVMWW